MADEMNVGRQMRKNAFAPVSAVAGEDDLVVGVPLGHQPDEFEGQLGSSAMIGLGFGLEDLPRLFFPLVSPCRLRYSRTAIGKAKTFVGAQNGLTMIKQSATQSCPQLTRDLARLEIRGS